MNQIGGSCAGLFAAILLRRQGHNIHILESAVSSEREGLAAGIGLGAEVKRFFDENDRLKDVPMGTPSEFLEMKDWNMNVQMRLPISQRMTTWDAMYYRLRANFDAYKSPHCPEPPPLEEGEGDGLFDTGKRVLKIEGISGGVKVHAEDVETGEGKTYEADIVIAADGANSSIRRQLQPNLKRSEPGYVLWRGTVPIKNLSPTLVAKLEAHATLYQMRYSYAIL